MRLANIFALFEEPAKRIAIKLEEYGEVDPPPRSITALKEQLASLSGKIGSDPQFDSLLITLTGFWEGATATVKIPCRDLNGGPFPHSQQPSNQIVVESRHIEVTHDRVNLVYREQDKGLWVPIGFPDFKGIANFVKCHMEITTRA